MSAPTPSQATQSLVAANPQAEECLLAGCLASPIWRDKAASKLSKGDFYFQRNQAIFSGLLAAGNPSNPLEVASHSAITDRDRPQVLAEIGRWLTNRPYASADPDRTIAELLDLSARRKVIALHQSVDLGALARTDCPLESSIDAMIAALESLRPAQVEESPEWGPDIMAQLFSEIHERASGKMFPSLGFQWLDELIGGWQPGKVVIGAGRPGMGKSAFMLALVKNLLWQGLPTKVFSLEMGGTENLARMLAAEAGVPVAPLQRGVPCQDDFAKLQALSESPIWRNLWIDDKSLNVTQMARKIRQFKLQHPDCPVVFLDYLGLMAESDDLVRELDKITREAKALARDLGITVVILSQLSRAVENRANKRPMLLDLRDSGGIEQNADIVFFLYRDEYYDPDSPHRGVVEVIIAKHRGGPLGTVELLFDPTTQRFSDPIERRGYG